MRKRGLFLLSAAICLLLSLTGCGPREEALDAKPVIYLYPQEETAVTVKLDFDGELTASWPAYENGWSVTALPDGTLTDSRGREYSYLFWEGISDQEYDFSQGFCISGRETGSFLREALTTLGLTPREYNEFIVYWLPRMEQNPWNLIAFQDTAYTDHARLEVSPSPDSILRVFMAWKPLDASVDIQAQELKSFQRQGFTLVEWGGAEVS